MSKIVQFDESAAVTLCFYCSSYQKVIASYPVNPGANQLEDLTPRCDMHFKYECSRCNSMLHFGGIAWCHNCQKFTCIRCSPPSMEEVPFFIFDYYYKLACHECNAQLNCLDFAEYEGSHPYQIGDLRPSSPLQVYFPIESEIETTRTNEYQGRNRVLQLSVYSDINVKSTDDTDSTAIWDGLADDWACNMTDGGDVNHREVIIPIMLDLLNAKGDEVILDVGCGEGNFTRSLAKTAERVVGVEPSKLIEYAKNRSQEYPNICFFKLTAQQLDQLDGTFDKVTANMMLMDTDNLDQILTNIAGKIKEGGRFVLSISHPAFAWPVCLSIKLPRDSPRNEDRGWLVDNYLTEGTFHIQHPTFTTPWLYHHRMMSTYLNKLILHGFQIEEVREPNVTKKLAKQYPTAFYHHYDRLPAFLIISSRYYPNHTKAE